MIVHFFLISGDTMINAPFEGANLNGVPFSTVDRDNGQCGNANCAAFNNGGWWFYKYHYVFLNGPWPPKYWLNPWVPTIINASNIAEVRLMIKPT